MGPRADLDAVRIINFVCCYILGSHGVSSGMSACIHTMSKTSFRFRHNQGGLRYVGVLISLWLFLVHLLQY
jgi:hypothetical protein